MGKIITLEEMGKISQRLSKEGVFVVQAHGTFDFLHVGHVKYLSQAKDYGDALVVTLTADKFINKGPNRPVFPEGLRAEMLAALECVNYVVIINSADALEAIQIIQPAYYIKGQDYRNPEGDITGKILLERTATEVNGGKFLIADTEQFSSTTLINQYLNVYEPHLKSHLDDLRNNGSLGEMLAMIDTIKDKKILIIGEAITDQYQYVVPMAKASKESILATRFKDMEVFNGGSTMVRDMLRGFSDEVHRVTWERIITKTRFVEPIYTRKLFEVSYINDDPILPTEEEYLHILLKEIEDYDVVIVLDYGHGMISDKTIEMLYKRSKFLAVNTQTNSSNYGYNLINKYPSADLICIDMPEARLATHDRHSEGDAIVRKVAKLTNASKVIVTNGRYGCLTYDKADGVVHTIPAIAKNALDTMGAGDAFLAIAAPLVAQGLSLDKVGFIGNIAGAIKTGIIGHKRPVNKIDIVKALTGLLK